MAESLPQYSPKPSRVLKGIFSPKAHYNFYSDRKENG